MTKTLSHIEGLILDLDGVVYQGDQLLPGAKEFFGRVRDSGRRLVALTNHSGGRAADFSEKLERLGIALAPEQIVTSSWATARWLAERQASVFAIGSQPLLEELSEARIEASSSPSHVVVGYSRRFDYSTLSGAVRHLLAGAELVATNPDALLPTPQGALPETGPLVRYLEYASGKTAAVVGKPNPYIVRLALERLSLAAGQVVMVGDTWATDIEAAKAANLWSVLLKTGNGFHPLSPERRPTFHLDGLLELTALL